MRLFIHDWYNYLSPNNFYFGFLRHFAQNINSELIYVGTILDNIDQLIINKALQFKQETARKSREYIIAHWEIRVKSLLNDHALRFLA